MRRRRSSASSKVSVSRSVSRGRYSDNVVSDYGSSFDKNGTLEKVQKKVKVVKQRVIASSRKVARKANKNLRPPHPFIQFTFGLLCGILLSMTMGWSTPYETHIYEASKDLPNISQQVETIATEVAHSTVNFLSNSTLATNLSSPISSITGADLLTTLKTYMPSAQFAPNVTAAEFFAGLTSLVPSPPNLFSSSVDEFMPAARVAREDHRIRAKHPVIIIPGMASTALEAWTDPPRADSRPIGAEPPSEEASNPTASELPDGCAKNYFRKRMWGALNQLRAILLDRECWLAHMKLDAHTGLDPPGARLRAALGLDAADYLWPGYWVFAKLISNLGAIGYDNNNMQLAGYDWRLSFADLEVRDQYFSRLKTSIEVSTSRGRPKAVILAHSMGNLVFKHFLAWVMHPEGGAADEDWADRHLHAWVSIGAPFLGTPSAVPALLSGEMRNTVSLNAFYSDSLERYFGKRDRAAVLRTWGSIHALCPRGGETIWGKLGEPAPDETPATATQEFIPSYSTIIDVRPKEAGLPTNVTEAVEEAMSVSEDEGEAVLNGGMDPSGNYTVNSVWTLLINVVGTQHTSRWNRKPVDLGLARTREEIANAKDRPETWSNPLISPLPMFKSGEFRMYGFYGVGSATERKYFYNAVDEDEAGGWVLGINVGFDDAQRNVSYGVQTTDGDVTIPLISLGYMCTRGWKHRRYNPSLVPCVTREYTQPLPYPETVPEGEGADHTSILGNHAVTEDILRIVSGVDAHEHMPPRFLSDIEEISRRVDQNLEQAAPGLDEERAGVKDVVRGVVERVGAVWQQMDVIS
ncbi:hypothetical protein HDV00_010534 [Rhizophlyctis rosea]|nr:hypothetical protein HDV00_010534 [Rhizophlyctis rosea]